MRLFQLVILFGQLFHIHLAVRELPGQLSSGGVELYQFRFMLCLVLGSGELNIKASVIIELRKFYNCSYDEFFAGLDE